MSGEDILATSGAFMAVLIAIEIFININIYLRDDVIHVKIVMATALMAIARKVILMDFDRIAPEYVWATAAVVLALSVGYWLVVRYTADEDVVSAVQVVRPAGLVADIDSSRQESKENSHGPTVDHGVG